MAHSTISSEAAVCNCDNYEITFIEGGCMCLGSGRAGASFIRNNPTLRHHTHAAYSCISRTAAAAHAARGAVKGLRRDEDADALALLLSQGLAT